MKSYLKKLLLLLLFFIIHNTNATHIVGGELFYEHLGGYNYQVTLKFYRDCGSGNAGYPSVVRIRAFFNGGQQWIQLNAPNPGAVIVPPVVDTCVVQPGICLEETFYTGVMYLPPVEGGYHILFDYGNRNSSLDNILNPVNETEAWYAFVPNDTNYIYTPLPSDTPFWLENFTLPNGTISDVGATAWTRTMAGVTGFAEVRTGVFEARNTGGEVVWSSEIVNIAAFPNGVDLSVNLSERGNQDDDDYIRTFYKLNGGPEIAFSTNGNLFNDFLTLRAKELFLIGTTIQIIIRIENDENSERHSIDNVSITPSRNCLWFEGFNLPDNTTVDAGVTAWSRTIAGGTDYAEVRNNLFDANDTDGEVVWTSEVINILAEVNGVDLFADLTETGNHEAADYIHVFYKLNGGPETPFTANGVLNNDFNSAIASVKEIIGNDVQIVFRMMTSSDDEHHFIDNVIVCPARIAIDTTFLAGGPNSSPVFTNLPPIFVCANEPFCFDHSATDADGDSLVYYLCAPYKAWNNTPYSTDAIGPPPFDANGYPIIDTVTFVSGYSSANPFGPGTSIDLDPATGELCADMAGNIGQYVVGVCVDEYRGDSLLNTNKKDFQFNGVFCPNITQSLILDTAICTTSLATTVSFPFLNVASGSTLWNFGDPSTLADTSNLYTPSYTYPDTGNYTITLIINRGTPCVDTGTAFLHIQYIDALFTSDVISCVNQPITFTSTTTLSSGTTPTYAWNFGDANISSLPNPVHTYTTAGTYTARLIVFSSAGCSDTVTQQIVISPELSLTVGPDIVTCSDQNVNVSAIMTGSTSIIWTTSGTGTFTNDTLVNTAYNFSVTEINSANTSPISITLYACTNNNGSCNEICDSLVVTINGQPTITVLGDISVCANNPDICLTATITNATGIQWDPNNILGGSFSPSSTSLNVCYTPSVAEITAGLLFITAEATGIGTCNAIDANHGAVITPAPIVNAGPDDTTCINNPVAALTASGGAGTVFLWTTSGDGSFSSTNTEASIYTPGINDIINGSTILTFSSTLTVPSCTPVTDDLVLIFSPAPIVNAGIDTTVCANNSLTNITGIVNGAIGGSWTTLAGLPTGFGNSNSLITTYQPTTADTAAGSVCLVLTSTGNGGCTAVTDTMCISFSPAPVADAGIDITICSNNAITTLSGNVQTPAIGGTWSGGTGVFSPNVNTLNATYTATPADTLAGNITLTLTSTGSTGCIEDIDDVLISFTTSPSISAGLNDTICANNAIASLTANVNISTGVLWTGGAGTITSPTNLTTTYIPTNGEIITGMAVLYVQSTGNGLCLTVRDTVNVIITAEPTANAGADQTICANNPTVSLNGGVTNANGGIWVSLGDGVFSDINILNPTYTPGTTDTASGTVQLIIETTGIGGCISVFDTMIITITDAPTVDAGTDQIVCANNSVITLAGIVSSISSGGNWTGGLGIYSPNASSLNATYVPSQSEISAGIVNLTLTTSGSGNCLEVSDNMSISITPPPTINIGPDLSVCADAPSNTLSAALTVATGVNWIGGAGTYVPNNTTNPAVYIPSPVEVLTGTATIIGITTNNGNCSTVSDTLIISIAPFPAIDAGPDQVVCGNVSTININGTVLNVGGGIWTTSGTGSFANITNLATTYSPSNADTASGSITLTLTTTGVGNCLVLTDSLIITFEATPTIDAGSDLTICSNQFPILLQGAGSPAIWSGGAGTFSNINLLNSSYSPDPTEIGSVVTLTLTTINSGSCPPISDQVVFTLPPGPTANAGNDITICGDIISVNLTGVIGGSANGSIWLTSGTGAFGNVSNLNTTYTPSAQDLSNGGAQLIIATNNISACPDVTDTLNLIITPSPTVDAGFPQTVCADVGCINLNGTVTVSTGGQWNINGAGNGTFGDVNSIDTTYCLGLTDIANGTVTLTLTSTGNGTCNAVSDDVIIIITPAPSVDAGSDLTICADSSQAQLSGLFTVAGGVLWSSANGTGTFSPNAVDPNATYFPSSADTIQANQPIIFVLSTTGNGTCNSLSDTMELTITPKPVINVGVDVAICVDQLSASLTATIQIASGVIWSSTGNGSFNNSTILTPTYTIGSTDTTLGIVTLTGTTTGNGQCNAVSDNMNIIITPGVVVSAGSDQSLCADASLINLVGSVQVATGGTWSTLGSGTFGNVTNLITTYIPSIADTTAGCVSLILTSTGNGLCNAVADTVIICFLPIPKPNAGPDVIVCADTAFIQFNGNVSNAGGGIWSSSGTGVFSPNATTLNATYRLSSSDSLAGNVTVYLETTGNGACFPITDSMQITITPAPSIDLGADLTICADLTAVNLTANVTTAISAVWATSGSGNFTPLNGLTSTYSVDNLDTLVGTINIIATTTGNGMCKAVTDQLTLTISDKPTANAGLDQDICSNVNLINLNGIINVATGGVWATSGTGTFVPNNTILNSVYAVTAADSLVGFVTFILSTTGNGTCNAVSDTMRVNLQHVPTIDAGADITVCADTSLIQLTGAMQVSATGIWTTSGGGSFSPDQFNTNPIYVLDSIDKASTIITLTFTTTDNGLCTAVSDDMILTITPSPTIDAGVNQVVCADVPTGYFVGSVTVASGGIWSTASGLGTFAPNDSVSNPAFTPDSIQIATGIVVLTFTSIGNGQCNSVSDNVTLTINPSPIVNAGFDQTLCASSDSFSLNGIVTNAAGGQWQSSGLGSFNPNNAALNSTYDITSADTSFGSVMLILTSTGNGLCNSVTDSVVLNFAPIPSINIGPFNTLCVNELGTTIEGFVLNAGGMVWSTSGTGVFTNNVTDTIVTYTPSLADLDSGIAIIYLVSTQNGICAPDTDQITLEIAPIAIANAGVDQVVCTNNPEALLNGSFVNANEGIWSSNGTGSFDDTTDFNATYTLSGLDLTTGLIILTWTQTDQSPHCDPVIDSLLITVSPGPTADAGIDQTICGDKDSVQVSAIFTIATGVQWTTSGTGVYVNSSSTATTYLPSNADIIAGSVILYSTTTGNGLCSQEVDSLILTITPPITSSIGSDTTICGDQSLISLTASLTIAGGGIWSSSSAGVFSPGTTSVPNVDYTISSTDTANGSVDVYFETTGNGLCIALFDTITVSFQNIPGITVSPDAICSNEDTVLLGGVFSNAGGMSWTSAGDGVFTPVTTLINTNYVPGVLDIGNGGLILIAQTTGNGVCAARIDSVILTISDAPFSSAGADIIICADTIGIQLNGAILNAGGSLWTTTGDGNFDNGTLLNATYTPGSIDIDSGYVDVYLTTTLVGICAPYTDTVRITITPAPTVDIMAGNTCTSSDTLFLTSNVTVSAGVSWSTSGDGVFDPNSTFPSPNYLIGAADLIAGNFTIILNTTGSGLCNEIADTLDITLTPAPLSTAGNDTMVCGDNPSILLNGSISNAGGGIWSTSGSGSFDNANLLNATYTYSQIDIDSGSVVLTLLTSGNGICNSHIDSFTVTFTPIPTVDAGDGNVCTNNPVIPILGVITTATGGTWGCIGCDGSFDNATNLATNYNPGVNDVINDNVILTLCTTGNGNCQTYCDTVTIQFDPAPTANVNDNTVCADTVGVNMNGGITIATGGIWSSLGGGSFINTIDLNTIYIPSQTVIDSGTVLIVLTTTGNGDCNAVTDTMTLTIDPAPIVDAGVDFDVCADTIIIPIIGVVTNATGGQWSILIGTGVIATPNNLSTTYTPTSADSLAGSVSLLLTSTGNGLCNSVVDTLNITILPAPTVSSGSGTICSDQFLIPLNGLFQNAGGIEWTTSGAGFFVPSPLVLNTQYARDTADITAGQVELIITTTGNGLCKAVSDTIIYNLSPLPSAEAGPNQGICSNVDTVVLAGSIITATGGNWTTSGTGTFTNNTDLTGGYIPTGADSSNGGVTLTLCTTGNIGCPSSCDTMIISIADVPTADAGSDTSVCANVALIDVNGLITIANGGVWSTLGTGVFTPSPFNLATSYQPSNADTTNNSVDLVLTTTGNGSCPSANDTMTIIFTGSVTVFAGNDTTICAEHTGGVNLTSAITIASGGVWATSGSGIFNDSSLTPTVNYIPSSQDILDSFVIITLVSTGNGTCISGNDNMTIFINPTPNVDAGFDMTVCADSDSVPLNGSVNIATGGIWTTLGDGSFVSNTILNTTYLLGTTDKTTDFVDLVLTTTGNGLCNSITDTLHLNITPRVTIFAGNDTTICQNAIDIPFMSSLTVANGGTWTSTGTGTFSPSILADTGIYTLSTSDTSLTSMQLIFTSTGNGNCLAGIDTIEITFQPLPNADAGIDQTICADNPQATMAGSIINSTGGIWSGGNGSFNNTTDLNTVYNVSQADISNGTVNIFLTTVSIASCSDDVDAMIITVNPAPTVEAGADQAVCADNTSILMAGNFTVSSGVQWTTTNGTGSFDDPLNPTTIYNKGTGDELVSPIQLILTTTGNGLCNPVSDTMLFAITPAPIVDAGIDDTLCADIGGIIFTGASFDTLISSNILWTTSTLGTFDDPTLLSATFTPNSNVVPIGNMPPLVITFQIETQGSGTCTERFDTRLITLIPIPTIDAGADDTVCVDIDTIYLSSNVQNATSAQWSGGNGTYPNGQIGTNVTYLPTVAERVPGATLVFTAQTSGTSLCLVYTDQVFVTFEDKPTVNVGPDQLVCADVSGVDLNGIVTFASNGTWNIIQGQGSWTSQFTDTTMYLVSANDTIAGGPVVLILTSNPYKDCKQYSDTIQINFDPEPTVSAGGTNVCADVSGFNLFGSFANSTGIVWTTTGDGSFSPNANAINPVYIPGAQDIIDTNVVLYISNVITNSTCAPKTDSINVTIIPLPIANGGNDLTICRGGTVDLVGSFMSGNTTQYQWYTINGIPIGTANPLISITASTDTLFVYQALDLATSCAQFDTVNVTMYDPPVLNLPDNYCIVDGLILDGAPVPATPINSFQWLYDGAPIEQTFGVTTYIASQPGTYIFSFQFDQCKVYDTTIVNDTPTVFTEDLIVCIGQSIDIEVDAPTGVSYIWTDTSGISLGTTNPVNVIANADTINNQNFFVEVTDANGCKSNIGLALTKLPPPILELENMPVCIGDEVTLNATPSNILDSDLMLQGTYSWFVDGDSISGATDSILEVLVGGNYTVIFGIGQCKGLDSSNVDFHELPVPDMQQRYETCIDYVNEVVIDAGEATSYYWENSKNTEQLETVFSYGEFAVTIYNEWFCEARDTVEIIEICEPKVFPPTGFIPNGQPCDPLCDECDNCFQIKGGHYRNWNLVIYNRWGEVIFYSTDSDIMWDGSYKGEPMPAGVYPWTLYYEGDSPRHFGPYNMSGKIAIIK